MNTNQIKLILMNYSEDEYVPELGGIYMRDKIVVRASDLHHFICKHDIGFCNYVFTSFVFEGEIKTMRKLIFYMNLLNFNGYSSWKIVSTSIETELLIKFIKYLNVPPSLNTIHKLLKWNMYIIYRNI
jgi:hypothetical protein